MAKHIGPSGKLLACRNRFRKKPSVVKNRLGLPSGPSAVLTTAEEEE